MRSLTTATPTGDWTSVCVVSDGSYGIAKGIISGFPIRTDGTTWEIVQGLPITPFAQEKINATLTELTEERDAVAALLA